MKEPDCVDGSPSTCRLLSSRTTAVIGRKENDISKKFSGVEDEERESQDGEDCKQT